MKHEIMNEALRSPLASTDPSFGSYALSQAAWKLVNALNK
ncbi:hypothetical protein D2E25_0347 [Bifidobacterium goeldii]|uniref:Uncharacterized protein n=1 Tax=Bifidobacterium goeldii TaxID=2306975 RepID=A0A430FMR0_9BIFI|nr:hypothetical protein D2E25_0347 [Bifidobacterium goeldii]